MATNYNYFGNLVTSGLVLDLDAAKLASYPGSGTTWRDISGNNYSGSLTNGPTFSGIGKQAAIVFDGIDDKVVTANSFTQTNVTLNTWFQFNNISDQVCAQSWNYSTTGGFTIEIYGGNLVFAVNGPSGAYPTFPVSSSITGSFRNLTGTLSGNTQTLYLNGSPISSVTDANRNNSNSNTPLTVGARSTGGPSTSFSNGKCGVAQVYNRALSQFEVWQNFNAIKGRYGIPDIVTNGLVLNLDAGNPYSYLSGSSGTTWTNTVAISSSISGTLVNGTTYSNGSMVFDGVDDYVTGSLSNFNVGCISIWINPSTLINSLSSIQSLIVLKYTGIIDSEWYISLGSATSYINNEYITIANVENNTRTAIADGGSLLANIWYNLTFNLESGTYKIYINGVQKNEVTYGGGVPQLTTPNVLQLGALFRNSIAGPFNGKIAISQIYNRALSATEITQNFNALRGRYGI
jgi:hypothetical protein